MYNMKILINPISLSKNSDFQMEIIWNFDYFDDRKYKFYLKTST